MAGEQRHELPVDHRAVDDAEVVVGPGPSAELDLDVVLIRPEVGDRRVGNTVRFRDDEVAGRGLALLHGVGPVLDPHGLAEERVVPAGHVAGGHDAGGARPAVLVAHNTILKANARSLEPAGLRHHARPDDDHVGGQDPAVAEANGLDPVAALEAGHGHAAVQPDAVILVQLPAPCSRLRPERVGQRRREGLHEVDLETAGAGGGRHLGADEPRSDDRHPRSPLQFRPQRQAVGQGPQDVDAAQGGRVGEASGGGAGGDHEAVEGHRLAVAHQHRAALEVEGRRSAAEAPVGRQPLDGRRGPQRREVRLRFSGQDLLRQRRAVVGQPLLAADHHDPAVVAEVPQSLDGRQAGQRGADHGHGADGRGEHGPFPAPPAGGFVHDVVLSFPRPPRLILNSRTASWRLKAISGSW